MAAAQRDPSSTVAQRFVWCLYDFGNSAFPTVIITTAYALYFKNVVAGGRAPGAAEELWGKAVSLGALSIFVTAPLLGAIADRLQKKRALLWFHAWLCVVATALLAYTGEGTVALAMGLLVVGLYAFEGANVFYNAYLPDLVPTERMPALSAKAWAFGYVGGLLCLLVVIGLSEGGVGARWLPLVVAAWFLVFTFPTLWVLRDAPRAGAPSAGVESTTVWQRLARIRTHKTLLLFLAALFFYMNGLNTVYVFAALFATTLGFSDLESIVLVMVMNVIAAPGAMLFARIAERRSARKSILLSLWLWLVVVAGSIAAAWPEAFETEVARKGFFWGVAGLASVCIGATQATSRTFVGQIAPPSMSGEFFGFMAFAGKASAILGPFVFGYLAAATDGDHRLAVGSIGVFFAIGLALLLVVPEPGPNHTDV